MTFGPESTNFDPESAAFGPISTSLGLQDENCCGTSLVQRRVKTGALGLAMLAYNSRSLGTPRGDGEPNDAGAVRGESRVRVVGGLAWVRLGGLARSGARSEDTQRSGAGVS